MKHSEFHRTHRIGWLRAAVLGANDGIVSTASLIVGVAAAESSRGSVLVAGSDGTGPPVWRRLCFAQRNVPAHAVPRSASVLRRLPVWGRLCLRRSPLRSGCPALQNVPLHVWSERTPREDTSAE